MVHLPAPPPPRLLDRVRAALRTRHCSLRTEKAYVGWIRRYIIFHGKRHPTEMGAPEITRFLSDLAIQRNVAASTQNQALSALLFLYRDVLEQELPWLDDIVRAKNPERIPVVLTREEVQAVIDALDGPTRLPALLLYGAGLRLLEALRLRVKDVDFGRNQITVRSGKGDKDRVTMLPAVASRDLAKHLETIRDQHDGWSCPGPSPANTPAPAASGSGSGSFRPPAPTCTARPTSAAAVTCTNPCCSARSRRRYAVRGSPSSPPATPSATPLPPTS
jgi:integrase